jgi:NAD(P)-dependent dehydrogenase (short-subunit alcohol dehydrogenase family)
LSPAESTAPGTTAALANAYAPEPGSHAGRIVLVTGASDGIGQALALALARQGATVALLGRTQRKLARTYDQIVKADWPPPALLPFDFETAAATEYDALFAALEREFGRLDGLAHVAGILGNLSPIEQYDVPTWCKVLHVNLTAPFILTRTLLPLLRRSEDASIVFTSSTIARGARAYWGAYAASKFGTEGLMQVLAHELAGTTRIRVNSFNPGPTRTAMRRNAFPAEDATKLPEPAMVVPPYLFLLGPASRGINGAAIDRRQLGPWKPPGAPSAHLR